MEHLLEESVSASDLKRFETRYVEELQSGTSVSSGAQFEYAWCLVRSKYPADIRKGILLLEDLYKVSILYFWKILNQNVPPNYCNAFSRFFLAFGKKSQWPKNSNARISAGKLFDFYCKSSTNRPVCKTEVACREI